MTTSKLPAHPSMESLRKQAKKLAREIVAGHASAIARARAQLPQAELPLSQRDAQLVLARADGSENSSSKSPYRLRIAGGSSVNRRVTADKPIDKDGMSSFAH